MNITKTIIGLGAIALLAGCGGSSSNSPPTLAPLPPAAIGVSGVVLDGPVSGGTLFVFLADDIQTALDDADAAEDRLASLNSANSIHSVTLSESEDGSYSFNLSGGYAGNAIFVVFDNAGSEDLTFGDTPFNMESVAVLGDAGSSNRVNVTPQTSVVGTQVRTALPLDASGVSGEIVTANTNVVSAFGEDQTGNELLPEGTDVITLDDAEMLEEAATFLGSQVRSTAIVTDLERDDVLEALALDALDGEIDGVAPGGDADPDVVEAVAEFYTLGEGEDADIVIGSCSSTADLLRRACDIDIMDDYFEGVATCQDGDAEELEDCISDAAEEREETLEECGGIYEARAALCIDVDDEVHDPEFGEAYADNFIDPLDIGDSVTPNPYFPLIQGNQWVYESTSIDEDDGEEKTETVTVTVKNETKLIQGIDCLVVNDIVEEDGEVVEDTDDWFAQDKEGNVWYCGEIARNFEFFDGDEPEIPELVDIDGSWKAGREGGQGRHPRTSRPGNR